MRRPFLPLLALILPCLVSCGPQVVGVATTAHPGPIASVLILVKPSSVVAEHSQADFADGLVRRLQSCHLRVETHRLDPLSLENGGSDEATANALVGKAQPDAVLSLVPERSFVGRDLSSTRFGARLIELRSRHVVWRGQAVVKSGLALGDANDTVGADLVQTMISTGVLQACSP